MASPRYRQVAEDLPLKIESGELPHGSKLPTELELSEQYSASRNAVRDALKWLMTGGLVETRTGQGTFIAVKVDPLVTTLTGDPEGKCGDGEELPSTLQRPHGTSGGPLARYAWRFCSPAGMWLQSSSSTTGPRSSAGIWRRSTDERPSSMLTSFYPVSLVAKGAVRLIRADDISEGGIGYLRRQLGIKQVGCRDKILVRPPDMNDTVFFKLPSDGRVPVIEIIRTGFDSSGSPFVVTVTAYPADRNRFQINIGDVPGNAVPDDSNSKSSASYDGAPSRGG